MSSLAHYLHTACILFAHCLHTHHIDHILPVVMRDDLVNFAMFGEEGVQLLLRHARRDRLHE